MQNRNKKVECDVCLKRMRSDHLIRHKLTHKDLLSLPDQIRVELEARQAIKEKQEAKVKKIKEIAQENNLSIPKEIRKPVDIENVCARCLQNYQLFLEKIEIGKQVAIMIENGEIIYESLGKMDKEAFDMYRKHLLIDISDITL